MSLSSPHYYSSSFGRERTIRKIDISQVSLSLQDRLGLAKVKYQNGRLHPLHPTREPNGSGRRIFLDSSDNSSSDVPHSRYESPLTSPLFPPTTTTTTTSTTFSSRDLPRSAHSRHAATFNCRVMQPMPSVNRKRNRSDSITDRPTKMSRMSWKSSYQLPESSPGFSRPLFNRQPYFSEMATIPEVSSPVYHGQSDDENDPDLPVHSFQADSAMLRSSPPRTPPPKHARPLRNDKALRNEDGADLLLYLANSPTPASGTARTHPPDLPPSTPPSQHAVLPSLTPTPGGGIFPAAFTTPDQSFNFADFVNVTPSPAQPRRTPGGGPSRTPLLARSARKMLNFDNLVPPGMENLKDREKGTLQLGEELRP